MRFLVTGGAGFIGSHLCDLLLERGHLVHVLDDLSTGSLENIRHLQAKPGFEYTIESAANPAVVAELVDATDVVYHLAAAVGVQLIVESPVRAIETNLHCTEMVLAHASASQKPVLIASTSEVYGKSDAFPFKEDDDLHLGATNVSRWAYACSKAIDEFLALAYWRERRLPTVVARMFNTVGPRQTGRYGMVMPRFVQQALANEPLTVFGDGAQTRCFCHVSDVARALADLMTTDASHGQIFNVGDSQEISILGLARRVIELTGSESEITLISYAEAYEDGFEEMYRRVPDTTRIGELIGWHPTHTLESVVMDVADHQRGQPAREIAITGAPTTP